MHHHRTPPLHPSPQPFPPSAPAPRGGSAPARAARPGLRPTYDAPRSAAKRPTWRGPHVRAPPPPPSSSFSSSSSGGHGGGGGGGGGRLGPAARAASEAARRVRGHRGYRRGGNGYGGVGLNRRWGRRCLRGRPEGGAGPPTAPNGPAALGPGPALPVVPAPRWGCSVLEGGARSLLGQLREVGALGVVLGLVFRAVAQRWWWW